MITEDKILLLYERLTEYNSLVRYYNRTVIHHTKHGSYVGPLKLEMMTDSSAGAGDMQARVTSSIRACLMTHMEACLEEAYQHVMSAARDCDIPSYSLELEEVHASD